MRKLLFRTFTFALLCTLLTVGASATMTNDTVKVGIKYSSDALFSANLENSVGSGYSFGYFNKDRSFVRFFDTDETKISVSADKTFYVGDYSGTYYESRPQGSSTPLGGYHVQIDTVYNTCDDAVFLAMQINDAFPAYINGEFCVRVGNYTSAESAQTACNALSGSYDAKVVAPSSTGVTVTRTGSRKILFEFDQSGLYSLGIMPRSTSGEKCSTWFKGYRYYGGFEYQRITGGNINVVNLVNVEDYVKCSIIWEMSNTWPLEALKAQAVCARTYAARQTVHNSSGFDVCTDTHCQVYRGMAQCTDYSNSAVDQTAGDYIRYNGKLIEAVYYSSNGGASEDAKNVWGTETAYLKGKADPYEALLTIPNYEWTTTYTLSQLTWVLQNKGYDIGTIKSVNITEYTPNGNVKAIKFTDTTGDTLTVRNETCRLIFNSQTYGKSAKSMRFTIGGAGEKLYVNEGATIMGVEGCYMLSGSGTASRYTGSSAGAYVITSSGTAPLSDAVSAPQGDTIVLTGTGSGHNVGMSQYGAKAMAESGHTYLDILNFYYTGVVIG